MHVHVTNKQQSQYLQKTQKNPKQIEFLIQKIDISILICSQT